VSEAGTKEQLERMRHGVGVYSGDEVRGWVQHQYRYLRRTSSRA
jgi:hypothetical protein